MLYFVEIFLSEAGVMTLIQGHALKVTMNAEDFFRSDSSFLHALLQEVYTWCKCSYEKVMLQF